MPTPVGAARQCLTDEAARALDEAVAVARRRSHVQTTSLHAVSALLALPSSPLREACARARTSACSPRLQFRALELSVGVSLDRLPTSKPRERDAEEGDGPPVSNSLMAAIKRSQANQRRHPENFYLYNQTASVLKVELKHFMLSILDDPIVSRVFGEAGFRNCDMKLAILHPPLVQSPKLPSRSLFFLCNMPGADPGRSGFGFPFSGQDDDGNDENCRRIVNVMLRQDGNGKEKGKNPLLIGVSSNDALNRFINVVNTSSSSCSSSSGSRSGSSMEFFPSELVGLKVVSLGEVVGDKERVRIKVEEISREVEGSSGAGLLVNYGELKGLVGEDVYDDGWGYLFSELKVLVESHKEKLWLIGAVSAYETFSELAITFPGFEKDLDLHLLPITSSNSFVNSPNSKLSLMRSFVPFGGFFSTPDDLRTPFSTSPSVPCCHLCTANYEQEVGSVLNVGSKVSVADRHSENIPSWLRMGDIESGNRINVAQTVDDTATMNAKILDLQKKWNDICQHHHHAQQFSKLETFRAGSPIKVFEGIEHSSEKKEDHCNRDTSPTDAQCGKLSLGVLTDSTFQVKQGMPIQKVSSAEEASCHSKTLEEASKVQIKGDSSPLILQGLPVDCTSPSVISVTSDTGFQTRYASSSWEPITLKMHNLKEHLQHFSASSSTASGAVVETTLHQIGQSNSCFGLSSAAQFDSSLYKTIRGVLAERVGWQDKAICIISEAVSHCKTKYGRYNVSNRSDIWLALVGPDRVAKKRIASALAEIILGSSKNLVSVDLSFHEWDSPSNLIFECHESNDYDVKFRGKTLIDHIAAELKNKPRGIIFLESIDKADPLVQSSLSQAVRTGKFSDSHGREISINNMIFVTTSSTSQKKNPLTNKIDTMYSEEQVLAAKKWQMNISVEHVAEDANTSNEVNVRVSRKLTSSKTSLNKRKWDGTMEEISADTGKRGQTASRALFDLNLPVEEIDTSYGGDCDSDTISENTEAWLEEFLDQVDETVMFKPFDFDALADKILKLIRLHFLNIFGSASLLEITHEAMVQILAASWSSDSEKVVEEWVEKVLGRGFTGARQKHRHLGGRILVRLATSEGLLMVEKAPGICLPSKITL